MFARLRRKHPGSTLPQLILYEIVLRITQLVYMFIYRVRTFHADRVPARGAVLLVSNHQSFLDPPAIATSIRHRHIDFIARLGLFKSPAFARFIAGLNATPIKEEGGDAAAIKEVIRRLGHGYAVLIFPEGSRTEDGAMAPFKRGVAVLVKRAGCPVVPVAVEGCYDAWPRERSAPAFVAKRIAVMFGRPIPHAELLSAGPDAALARLAREIDAMRLDLRAKLRRATHHRYPAPGLGDNPLPAGQISPNAPPSLDRPLATP